MESTRILVQTGNMIPYVDFCGCGEAAYVYGKYASVCIRERERGVQLECALGHMFA
jgi:hypothetical protein